VLPANIARPLPAVRTESIETSVVSNSVCGVSLDVIPRDVTERGPRSAGCRELCTDSGHGIPSFKSLECIGNTDQIYEDLRIGR
jgi:hypothetical protein